MTTSHFTPIAADAPVINSTFNNPMGELDAAINAHTHNPGNPNDGGQIDHNSLANKGTATHQQIDAHLGSQSNPHGTTLSQVAALGGSAQQVQVAAELAEAATDDTLTGTSSIVNNLNRIRRRIETIAGTTFAAAGSIVRSLANHTHNPTIPGDGGTVVQEGIAYDPTQARTKELSATPSIKDNLNAVRQDIYDLQQGISIGTGVITSAHIADKGLSGTDLADGSVDTLQLAGGAVDYAQMHPCRVTARSTATVKSLVVDINPGVYYLGDNTAIAVGALTYSWEGTMPTLADTARIDVLYLNASGQVLRAVGTPATNPSPPVAPDGTLPLVQVYLRGVTAGTEVGIFQSLSSEGITAIDSYVYRDIRPFLNLGGGGGGGGGGATILYAGVTDETPATTPNGTTTVFLTATQYLAGSTHVTVAPSGGDPIVYTRVASAPGAHQYTEDVALDRITFGVAPATGSSVRVSYFKGTTIPHANMVWDETPGGTINGSNLAFTTANPFISGSLLVFKAPSGTGTAERMLPGTHYTEATGLSGFTFTAGNAPAAGTALRVQYARVDFSQDNALTVGGFPASATPTANSLLALNASAKLPASITGDAATVGGFAPSQTPAAGQVPVVKGDGSTALPGLADLPFLAKAVRVAKNTLETGGQAVGLGAVAGAGNTTIAQVVAGTSGFRVRKNDDSGDLLSVDASGNLTFVAGLVIPNNQSLTLQKNATGNDSKVVHDTSNYLKLIAGATGFKVRNNADTADNLTLTDAGNLTVRGTLSAQATSVAGLTATGLTVNGSGSVTGALSVGGTLTAQLANGSVNGLLSTSHYNLLAGATSAATSSTIVMRDSSGHIYAGGNFNMAANEGRTDQPYMLFGRTSADSFLRTFNPAYLAVNSANVATTANALAVGTTDGNKLHNLDTSYSIVGSSSWRRSYLPNGKRIYTRLTALAAAAAPDQTLETIQLPDSLTMGSCFILCSPMGQNAQQIQVVARDSSNNNSFSSTSIVTAARSITGANLNTITGTVYANLLIVEL